MTRTAATKTKVRDTGPDAATVKRVVVRDHRRCAKCGGGIVAPPRLGLVGAAPPAARLGWRPPSGHERHGQPGVVAWQRFCRLPLRRRVEPRVNEDLGLLVSKHATPALVPIRHAVHRAVPPHRRRQGHPLRAAHPRRSSRMTTLAEPAKPVKKPRRERPPRVVSPAAQVEYTATVNDAGQPGLCRRCGSPRPTRWCPRTAAPTRVPRGQVLRRGGKPPTSTPGAARLPVGLVKVQIDLALHFPTAARHDAGNYYTTVAKPVVDAFGPQRDQTVKKGLRAGTQVVEVGHGVVPDDTAEFLNGRASSTSERSAPTRSRHRSVKSSSRSPTCPPNPLI